MWKWTRKASILVLGIVMLTAGVSCTSEDNFGPSTDQPSIQPDPSIGSVVGGTVGTLANTLKNLHLLSCSTQPYAATTKVVGPQGGVVTVGTHRLIIPAGALSRSVTIKAEQVPGNVNSVRFSPEGLQFSKPAALELSYKNCSLLLGVVKRVAYTDERLKILELIPSLDLLNLRTVRGTVRHFSRYAVAW
jgi:hypothetical protein